MGGALIGEQRQGAADPGGRLATGRLPQLDGLRGTAAIAVMAYHVHVLFGFQLGFERAYLFVDLFFLLSGFVLSLSWAPAFSQRADLGSLVRQRAWRLWPTIAGAALLGAAVHAALGDGSSVWSQLLLALLMIPAIWREQGVFPLNGPQWSLFWEFIANLAHLLVLRRLGERGLMAVALVMALGLIAAIDTKGANTFGPDGNGWWMALARVGWSYTVGMIMARLYTSSAWKPVLGTGPALALPVIAVLVLPFVPLPVPKGDAVTVIAVFPVLFWLLMTARPSGTGTGLLSRLGELSFPLYAFHLPMLTLFAASGLSRPVAAAAAVTLSIALASATSSFATRRHRPRGQQASALAIGSV